MKTLKMRSRFLLTIIGMAGLLSYSLPVLADEAKPAELSGMAVSGSDLAAAVKAKSDSLAANGDPAGDLVGSETDVTVADASKGISLLDLAKQVGQNKIAINFTWTLICGFIIMFMQPGFAIVETGLCRAKNANHTMMMNFMVYGLGLFAYWVCGFAIQMGGVGAIGNLGGGHMLNAEKVVTLFGKTWGLFGTKGFFLSGSTYDVTVMVVFLFQMVFMDTTTTIVTGTCAERWKYSAFAVSTVLLGAFIYPLFANWAWGCGWLSQLGVNFGLGHGYVDFAGSGVVHAVGGLTACAVGMQIGPRIGKFNRDGSPNAIPGHDLVLVLMGCFILAFGWFGFNPGSTLGMSGNGALRASSVAVNTMLAGMMGSFSSLLYMWIRYGKPDASMAGNGFLAGLVAITAPSGFVGILASIVIGWLAGFLVCLAVEFFDRVPRIDDPVGAMSVHGVNGIFGVIATGLFADGRSNYGGSWNGVAGPVKGLFYGDAGQLVAQLIGVATLVGVVFTMSFIANWIVDYFIGQRVGAKAELQGLDIPEMGAVAYPDFVLKADK